MTLSDLQKSMSKHRIYHRVLLLHILSSGICPNGSSIFVFLWLLAMVARAYPESQIENQDKKKSIDIHVRRATSFFKKCLKYVIKAAVAVAHLRVNNNKKNCPHMVLDVCAVCRSR
jgi:hypothetical protein